MKQNAIWKKKSNKHFLVLLKTALILRFSFIKKINLFCNVTYKYKVVKLIKVGYIVYFNYKILLIYLQKFD